MTKAADTRMLILRKAYELIYVKGYQATSIDEIIAQTQVTKGAFFYHFRHKDEMGLAVIKDLMAPAMHNGFSALLKQEPDPVRSIYKLMHTLLLDSPELLVEYGCPAANLSQEMSPLNSSFGKALNDLVNEWKADIIKSIKKGKKQKYIRKDVNAGQVAVMVMSGYWGVRNFGKLYGNSDCYQVYLKELKHYLKGLQ